METRPSFGWLLSISPERTGSVATVDSASCLSASYQLTGSDDDFDGLDNLAEFALGGNPTNPADQGYAIWFGSAGSIFHYVYPRRKNSGLLYMVETTTNLVSGVWTNAGLVELPAAGELDTQFDMVTNELSIFGANQFLRLHIEVE